MQENPFSTCYIKPGAVEYLFADGRDALSLIDRLREAHWQGQIVGPHGAGKSTLLATLLPLLAASGRQIVQAELHNDESALPPRLRDTGGWNEHTQIVVDGYEQLSRFSRWRLRRSVARHRAGLLVTAHRTVGLTTLAVLEPTLDDVLAVVKVLLGNRTGAIRREQVAGAFAVHRGNVRETLFELYDQYERQRR